MAFKLKSMNKSIGPEGGEKEALGERRLWWEKPTASLGEPNNSLQKGRVRVPGSQPRSVLRSALGVWETLIVVGNACRLQILQVSR